MRPPQPKKSSTAVGYRERVLGTLVHIEARVSDPDVDLTLGTLANHAGFSPFHFQRIFRAIVGESPTVYVRRLRLERAAHELRVASRTGKTIGRVAVEAGYGSHEAFVRAFRATFGVAPSSYRRRPPARYHDVAFGAPGGGEPGTVPARVERIPRVRVAFVRHVGPYENVPPAFSRLAAWLAKRGSAVTGGRPLFLGAAHDDPTITPSDRLRFDCCVEVPSGVSPSGDVGVATVGGGDYVAATHAGPFETLADTYACAAAAVAHAPGRVMRRAPALELYLTPPDATAPLAMLTEVLLPITRPTRTRDFADRR